MGMPGGLAGIGSIQSEKETRQCLTDCLASYLERVRSLERHNRRLESKIQEHLEKKGPYVGGWWHYFKTIKVFASSVDNACIVPQSDNMCLTADDFRSSMR